MIKQRTLGRTGLKVSEICLGTINFGWKTKEQESLSILDAYHAAGGNFIQGIGHCPELSLASASTKASEEIVGKWWRSRGIPRSNLVLATRVNLGRGSEAASLVKFARDCVRESLRRLRTSYVDLLVIEWSDSVLPSSRLIEVFNALVREGLTRYIGAADFSAWRIAEIIGRARDRNSCRMEALQSDYSLLTRARFEPEAMALCEDQRLGFIARSPLAGGFLTQSDHLSVSRREWLDQRYGNIYGDAALAALNDVARKHGATPARTALAWVLHNPAVTSAVVGVQSATQLHDLLHAAFIQLSESDRNLLHNATAVEEVRIGPDISPSSVPAAELALN